MSNPNELLEQLRESMQWASFHYADDSTSEWGKAREYESKARELAKEIREKFPGNEDQIAELNKRSLIRV